MNDEQNAMSESPEFPRFVRDKINPILGACFHEGAGRVQFGGSSEVPTPGIDFLRARTAEAVQVILGLVRSMRELKASRNFPGENPAPEYDRGIEDCVRALEDELLGPSSAPAADPTEITYQCRRCGKPRTKAQGGAIFTVCDDCWNADAEKSGHPNRLAPPPSEPSRTDAVKEAIALVKRHDKCGRGQVGICRFEGEGKQCTAADDLRPVIFALADAEHESAHYKDELAAATKRERALEERAVDYERKLADATSEFFPSEFMLGGFRHKVTAVEGHYDGSYIVAQKIGEFDPPTKPLPPPSELAEAAERKLQVERARVADLTSRLAATEKWSVEGWTCNAALTRKLGMALKALKWYANAEYNSRTDSDVQLQSVADYTLVDLAAIDAPAGEEAGAMLTKCNICILSLAHAGSHVNYPLGTQHDAPPPEPANDQTTPNPPVDWDRVLNSEPASAQGSERDDEERFDSWLEAQGSAPSPAVAWDAALRYERRRVLERDDALERAAKSALELLHSVFDFTKRTPQVEATIANLSAVLAQHAGKAE